MENCNVQYVSNNIGNYLPLSPHDILGKPLNYLNDHIEFSGSINFYDFCMKPVSASDAEDFSTTLTVQIGRKHYYLVVSHSADLLILEFQQSGHVPDVTTMIFNMASRVLSMNTLEELYQTAAGEIKKLIGYDRVMIYKFLPDGSGEVVGEAVNDTIEPFMGQRYPESDIPRQARALYKLNRMRLTSDVSSEPVEIIGNSGLQPFDMTQCTLRAVSPTHILYLKNMGVASSFSISIIVDNELWGLVTCHNYTPKHIDYRIMQSAMLLTNVISVRIFNKTSEIHKLLESRFQKEILQLQYQLSINNTIPAALTKSDTNLCHVTSAKGVALMYDDKIYLLGDTPGEESVRGFAAWVSEKIEDNVFITNELPLQYAAAGDFAGKASGALVASLDSENRDLVIWFKPEKIKTILWAGEPKKAVITSETAEGGVKIVPRESFKVFKEIVKQTSDEWGREEIASAKRMTQIIRDLAFKKAEEQNAINKRLKAAYDELDSFTYTVSHDLKNPLGVIKNYAQFLIHANITADDRGKSIVNKIIAGSDRITTMLQKLLELSRTGRDEISYERVKMGELIKNVIDEQMLTSRYGNTEILQGEQPDVKGSALLVYHIFSNVISNAFKYSSQREKPVVKINGRVNGDFVVYEIEDNGIGMSEDNDGEAYILFKRLSNAAEFEGTGAGLAIAKKNIEKLGGNISYKSILGRGTTFYLTFFNKEAATS